ncbi:hypothetical protein OS493_009351 [Desmophyllum pertusum]|uniref:Secreted protein n=1 Tax=Desmophyllum pertusum TaxID=174260 RepID=A0A9X0CS47_9CNID|nr:hypothetical protein OS493_009351 [Desmophyllum pertusum]
MKRFALFVLLATMVCLLVCNIHDTEGQLGFNFPPSSRNGNTGRSLNNKHTIKRILSQDPRMQQQSHVMTHQSEEMDIKEVKPEVTEKRVKADPPVI